MEECVIIVDNSNIWIEGMKHSANIQGIPPQPDGKPSCDYKWRIDFGKLLEFASQGKMIRKAILVGSRPPKNDSLWNAAEKKGFEVIVTDRNSQNKEKAVDTKLAVEGTKLIYSTDPAILKVLSGDSDFIPLIECANDMNWETEIWAFSSSLGSGSLMNVATRIEVLDDNIDKIQL